MKNKSEIAQRIIQGIATLLGVLGVALVVLGLFLVTTAFRGGVNENSIGWSFMTLFYFIPGALMIYAAYKALFRVSSQALSDVSGLCGFIVWVLFSAWLRKALYPDMIFWGFAYLFTPIVAGYGVHKLLKWLFMKLIYPDETKEVIQ